MNSMFSVFRLNVYTVHTTLLYKRVSKICMWFLVFLIYYHNTICQISIQTWFSEIIMLCACYLTFVKKNVLWKVYYKYRSSVFGSLYVYFSFSILFSRSTYLYLFFDVTPFSQCYSIHVSTPRSLYLSLNLALSVSCNVLFSSFLSGIYCNVLFSSFLSGWNI